MAAEPKQGVVGRSRTGDNQAVHAEGPTSDYERQDFHLQIILYPCLYFPSSVICIYSPDSASLFIYIQRHSQKDVMQPPCVNTGILQEAGFCLFPHHSAHLALSITSSLQIIFLNLLPFPNFIPVMSSYPQSKM